eukprot:CAMPEP_0172174612 /NCGR_PEP_ID=MMETSP1050-20130122/13768_1 /TAXON_ID=233186 /ORGANISM="Cryptomonas curvata, Strain CCAP979/52" /LENGTH=193 /DNA_ID=CAMNT_0012846621 /DNA_START=633 /DNA_END=1211 /DNA_ORIENTATION=-
MGPASAHPCGAADILLEPPQSGRRKSLVQARGCGPPRQLGGPLRRELLPQQPPHTGGGGVPGAVQGQQVQPALRVVRPQPAAHGAPAAAGRGGGIRAAADGVGQDAVRANDAGPRDQHKVADGLHARGAAPQGALLLLPPDVPPPPHLPRPPRLRLRLHQQQARQSPLPRHLPGRRHRPLGPAGAGQQDVGSL